MGNRATRTGGDFPPYRPTMASKSVLGALLIDSGLAVTYSAADGGLSAAVSSDDDGLNSVPDLRVATPSRNFRESDEADSDA